MNVLRYESEMAWLDRVEDTINRLRKPDTLRLVSMYVSPAPYVSSFCWSWNRKLMKKRVFFYVFLQGECAILRRNHRKRSCKMYPPLNPIFTFL